MYVPSLHCNYCHLKLSSSLSGGLIYLLDLYCNGTNPTVRERSAELFSKMMSDKLIGPKVKIVLAKFLPAIFMDAMRDNAEASVHMFEGELYKAKFSAGRRNCTSLVWLSIWNWSHHGKIFQSGKLYVKHDKDCFIRYLDSVVWYIKHDSSDYQTLRSNISNMRTSVSFDFQTL